ncbi:uncharacterized protein PAC_16641 [Phialocephala subalpina]|uniref:Nephrocystin 3-like N-terminal domain-containing protein n=1 Tax=Phialocephala subalpina TaxID=576137 RepID=A0A1L7XNU8_9HELO|nr:uncharacterized protein PAC_16641 [Phialocephala subalpina]
MKHHTHVIPTNQHREVAAQESCKASGLLADALRLIDNAEEASCQAQVQVGDQHVGNQMNTYTFNTDSVVVHVRDNQQPAARHRILNILAKFSNVIRAANPPNLYPFFRQAFKLFEYKLDFDDKAKQILDGTCKWFLCCKPIENWIQGQSYNILWITGSPGVGKTTLVINFIKDYDAILRHSGQLDKHATIYSLCASQENDTASKIICVAIHQLLKRFPDSRLPELAMLASECGLSTVAESQANQGDVWSARADFLWAYFCELIRVSGLETIFLIVDGLDECDGENQEKLLGLLEQGHSNLRVLITSRPLENITVFISRRKSLRILKHLDLHDKESDINADITRFIEAELERIGELRGYTTYQKDLAISGLKNGITGVFLPVVLILRELELSFSSDLESILDETANRLDALNSLYETLLLRLPARVLRKRSTILMCLLYSYRPFQVAELAYLCGYKDEGVSNGEESSTQEIGITKYQGLRNDIRLLSPILRVRASDDTVQFFHSSARTFIVERSSSSGPWQHFIASRPEGHYELAVSCLDTIIKACASIKQKAPHPWEDEIAAKEAELLRLHVFLAYAQRFWASHVKQAYYFGAETQNSKLSAVPPKFDFLSLFSNGGRVRDPSVLTTAARSGDLDLFKGIMENYELLDLESPLFSQILEVAVSSGQPEVVKFIQSKRQTDIRFSQTAGGVLTTAARSGDLDLFKGIMENYELLDLESPLFSQILEVAVSSGQPEVVKFIQSKRQTDIREFENALINAVHKDDMKVTNVLLECWNAEIKDVQGLNVLHSIASRTNVNGSLFMQISSLLQQRGLNINAKDKIGNTVLHHLSWNKSLGKTDLLKKMILGGVDPAVRNELEELPLHFAAARLDFEAFDYLLSVSEQSLRSGAGGDSGSSMIQSSKNSEPGRFLSRGYSTPLHWVAHRGASEDGVRIIKCLLSRGFQLTDATKSGRTPLSLALENVGSFSNLYSVATRIDGIDTFAVSRMGFGHRACFVFCTACMDRFGIRVSRQNRNPTVGDRAFIVFTVESFMPQYNCEHWRDFPSEIVEVAEEEARELYKVSERR